LIKAIIFDFDGLIIDTETAWYEAFNEVFQEHSLELPLDVFVQSIGTDDTVLNRLIEEQMGKERLQAIRQAAKEKHKVKMQTVTLRAGVQEYLDRAQAMGLRIGLASSSTREWVEGFLKELRIYDYFEVIRTGDQVTKVKPDPALYLQALEGLGVHASEAVAFEDSANGARAAVAAGIKVVIVPNEVTKAITFDKFDLRINSMLDKDLEQVLAALL
jgi:putative hydrolase of the HAD superfamily